MVSDGSDASPAETCSDDACGDAGCCGDHCCAAVVSNRDEFGALQTTGLVVAPPNGMFDTDAQCTSTSALGTCTVVSRGILGEACVCRSDELTVGTLRVTGSRALVLLVARTVTIANKLDISASTTTQGPGAVYRYTDRTMGFVGGDGGSYSTQGARGGDSSAAVVAATWGEPSLVPLTGGLSGRSAAQALGGGGGGALQISAGERISVPGKILAAGGGGGPGGNTYSTAGAGGGGSGGAVLLEAPVVSVTGSVTTLGGGGGGGGGETHYGTPGEDGNGDDEYASGGSGDDGGGCALYTYTNGGDGGAGATATMDALPGEWSDTEYRCLSENAFVGGGGGGGGLGRIRVNTTNGCQCNGTFVPAPSLGLFQVQ